MAKVVAVKLRTVIRAGPGSTILDNGTILDPEEVEVVDVVFDDEPHVQVERPATVAKVQAARQAAENAGTHQVDEIYVGMNV